MTTTQILQTIETHGGQLWLEGDKVRARLPESLRPLVSLIRERKFEIIEILSQSPVMPDGCRLVSYAPVDPPILLSPYEKVVDIRKFIVATLLQLEAKLQCASGWLYGWRSLPELLARLAAVGCHVALEDGKVMLQ